MVIATGGTAGHLYPAIKVATTLKEQGGEVCFIGSFRVGKELLEKKDLSFHVLNVQGIVGKNIFSKFKSVVLMGLSTLKARRLLTQEAPDVVIGFGSYSSVPVVLAAKMKKIPALIHEQNVVPGEANKFLAKYVEKVAISFPKTKEYFMESQTVMTGYPIQLESKQRDKANIYHQLGLQPDKKTVLIVGGSQGAQNINKAFVEVLKDFQFTEELQVFHICGEKDFTRLNGEYAILKKPVVLKKFCPDMDKAYSIADIVIARSGAGTVSEIQMYDLPAVLIPYPHAGNHQKENAYAIESRRRMVIEEKDLTKHSLQKAIAILLKDIDPDKKASIDSDVVNAAEKILESAEAICR